MAVPPVTGVSPLATTPPRWRPPAGAPRVATPIAPPRVVTPIPVLPTPPTEAELLADLVLRFPEPALVFDRRCLCACMNDGAALALGVNPDRAAGLGAPALGLPTEVAEAILIVAEPRRTGVIAEREVVCSRGAGVRRFRLTPHPGTGAVLLTWTDLITPQEAAHQTAALQVALRTLRERAASSSQRHQEALAHVRAALEDTLAALRLVGEELSGTGWGLPPGGSPAEVLAAESRRLRAVLAELAQVDGEPVSTRLGGTLDPIEL